MSRFFNTTGVCNPEKHYVVDPLRGIYEAILGLVHQESYFLLHAPRQTGKTTLLHELVRRLNREGKYWASLVSVERGGVPNMSPADADGQMVKSAYKAATHFLPEQCWPAEPDPAKSQNFSDYLTNWCQKLDKPLVLLVDEVDALRDDILISFLRQMRDGFQFRPKLFPVSVALVGLRDIREYRNLARGENPSLGAGSPFNVKAKSFLLPFFSKTEVDTLLEQHTAATGQVFSPKVRKLIFEFSGGQPWLTNALAKTMVEDLLGFDFSQKITPSMVEKAKEALIARRDTHLDSLLDKMRETRVRRVVMAIIAGDAPNFDDYDDAIRYCRDLGLVTQDRPVRFTSPIYREIITRVLNAGFHDGFNEDIVQTPFYLRPNGTLDMDKILRAFAEFYRRHSESWLERFEFKEAGHQLLLMAFLQRIVNGGGRIEREMALGNGRTDLCIFWKNQTIVLELKIRHDAHVIAEGKDQLARYLDKIGQPKGYLVVFEKKPSAEIPWEERLKWEEIEHNGKQLTFLQM